MIDIHSHIVFDVDDGPKTIEDSRALLEESYRQGVRTIISTSHRRKGMFETPEAKIEENFKAFLDQITRLKPASSKGQYLRTVAVSLTMGPGIKMDPALVAKYVG